MTAAGGLERAERTDAALDVMRSALETHGEIRLRVWGGSMVPAIRPGDTVVVSRRGVDAIRPGDVVMFAREGRLFGHRVVRREGARGFVTRGDALDRDDPAASGNDLLGAITAVVRSDTAPSFAPPRYNRLAVKVWQAYGAAVAGACRLRSAVGL